MAQIVKNLPAVQQTRVQSLVQEDPLEKGMPTHSTILAWRIPWTKEPGRLQSKGLQRVGQDLVTKLCLPHGRNCKVFSFGLNHGMPRYLVKHFGGVSVCSMFLDKSCVRICLLSKAVVLLSVGVVHPTS